MQPPSNALGKVPEKASLPAEKLSVTRHAILKQGKVLNYGATAGFLQLKDDSGRPKADIFFVAYVKEEQDLSQRPLTFLFNGGPGASSVWLHLGAAGPKGH